MLYTAGESKNTKVFSLIGTFSFIPRPSPLTFKVTLATPTGRVSIFDHPEMVAKVTVIDQRPKSTQVLQLLSLPSLFTYLSSFPYM